MFLLLLLLRGAWDNSNNNKYTRRESLSKGRTGDTLQEVAVVEIHVNCNKYIMYLVEKERKKESKLI